MTQIPTENADKPVYTVYTARTGTATARRQRELISKRDFLRAPMGFCNSFESKLGDHGLSRMRCVCKV